MRFFKPTCLKILTIVIFILVVGSLAAYLLGKRQKQSNTFSQLTPTALSPTSISSLWQIYTDATLGAIFEYPTSWKLIDTSTSPDIAGTEYTLAFEDKTVGQKVRIYISSITNPKNLSLADFYQRSMPGGAERYANIAFQETINPHGVRFEKIVQPYVSPDYNDTLDVIHNNKIFEITKTIAIPTFSGKPIDNNYHQDPIFQKAVAEYNHLINSFTFIN